MVGIQLELPEDFLRTDIVFPECPFPPVNHLGRVIWIGVNRDRGFKWGGEVFIRTTNDKPLRENIHDLNFPRLYLPRSVNEIHLVADCDPLRFVGGDEIEAIRIGLWRGDFAVDECRGDIIQFLGI